MKRWRFNLFALLVGLAVLTVAVAPGASAAIKVTKTDKVLFMIEKYGASGDSVVWKSSENLMKQTTNATLSAGRAGLTAASFANATTALKQIEAAITPTLNVFLGSMAPIVERQGYLYGRLDWYYTFTDAADGGAQKKVYIQAMVYPDGKIRNLGARIVASEPRILWYRYQTKATSGVLPPEYVHAEGGILHKSVLDKDLVPISTVSVDTGGRYDPPISAPCSGDISTCPEVDENPNAGLDLLMSEVVTPEMDDRNALYALIDYSREISPVYDCTIVAGVEECVASIRVEIFERKLTYDECTSVGKRFYNRGKVGHTYTFDAERYFVMPGSSYTLSSRWQAHSVSAEKDYAKEVVLAAGTTAASLQLFIIDPLKDTNQLLDVRNDQVNKLPCTHYIFDNKQSCGYISAMALNDLTALPNKITLPPGFNQGVGAYVNSVDYIYLEMRDSPLACTQWNWRTCMAADPMPRDPNNVFIHAQAFGGSGQRKVAPWWTQHCFSWGCAEWGMDPFTGEAVCTTPSCGWPGAVYVHSQHSVHMPSGTYLGATYPHWSGGYRTVHVTYTPRCSGGCEYAGFTFSGWGGPYYLELQTRCN